MFKQATTNTKQGDVGEARAIYEYTKRGYTVSRTLFDSAKYDLIIDDDGSGLKRVQVKTSQHKAVDRVRKVERTAYIVGLKTTGGNRKINTIRNREDSDYDVLFVLVADGRCWSIPTEHLKSKTGMCIGATGRGARYTEFELK